jgi:hypothetical protein
MACVVAMLAGLWLGPVWAGEPGVVLTSDGRSLEGEIVEEADQVVVIIRGIETTLPREKVLSIDYTSFEERFEQRIASLGPQDVDGRLDLAREALGRGDFDLAMKAAQAARDIDVLNREARDLENAITAQMRLQSSAEALPLTRPERRPTPPRVGPVLLGMDQIYAMRLAELTADDSRSRIQFRDNVRQRFLEDKPMISFRRFSTRPVVLQALDIRESGSSELKQDVLIINDPESLAGFFRHVHVPIVQGCATSRCHGGPDAGRLRLVSPAQSTEAAYTNLYLLMKYVTEVELDDNRPFGGGSNRLIDRGHGATSLLAQYMLPRERASKPHPPVEGFRALARDRDHSIYRSAVRWMDFELSRRSIDYGFVHDPWALRETEPEAESAEVMP